MGRRSRSRSPKKENRSRSPRIEHKHRKRDRAADELRSAQPPRRSESSRSPGRHKHRHADRRLSPVQRRSSPASRHSPRRADAHTQHRQRSGSSPNERMLPPPPPRNGGSHREPPPFADDEKPGKRRSRFGDVPDPAQLDLPPLPAAAAEHPAEALNDEEEPEPDFGLSGKLAAETNKVNGVVLLFSEPPEAANPQQRWRMYQFKGGKPFQEPLPIHRQSCYLFGRERRVADVPTDHPSCSKQHAVLQFRRTEKEGPDGMMVQAVRPYIMDLGSVNGTWVNNERVEAERYYELLEQDMVRFGNSTREYVLLHEGSAL